MTTSAEKVKRYQEKRGLTNGAMSELLSIGKHTYMAWFREGSTGRNCPDIYGKYCDLLTTMEAMKNG